MLSSDSSSGVPVAAGSHVVRTRLRASLPDGIVLLRVVCDLAGSSWRSEDAGAVIAPSPLRRRYFVTSPDRAVRLRAYAPAHFRIVVRPVSSADPAGVVNVRVRRLFDGAGAPDTCAGRQGLPAVVDGVAVQRLERRCSARRKRGALYRSLRRRRSPRCSGSRHRRPAAMTNRDRSTVVLSLSTMLTPDRDYGTFSPSEMEFADEKARFQWSPIGSGRTASEGDGA
ncbi:hypothetical protein FJZ36_06675 [Candidatus Poribacteria bacterium]|nr:hypothetical protein [Candidatus Poribacteria bacterium]